MERLGEAFYHRPCLEVAQDLVGKLLVHRVGNEVRTLRITQTEAYCGETDTACHARFGRTARTQALYDAPGTAYVYLCYGIHWLFNVVTGEMNQPEAVLIRACEDAEGPGKLTKKLGITGSINRCSLLTDPDIWIEDDGMRCLVRTARRVGIDYASPEDRDRLWRFILEKYNGVTEEREFIREDIR